jgi:hypothetical protein
MQKMKDVLGEEKFKQFRTCSSEFLKGDMMCTDYYQHFIQFFGKKHGEAIFPEMVDLLPDESKKDALLLAHNHYHSKEFGKPNQTKKKQEEKKKVEALKKVEAEQEEQNWPSLTPSSPTVSSSSSAAANKQNAGSSKQNGGGNKQSASNNRPPPAMEEFPSLASTSSSKKKKDQGSSKKGPKPSGSNVWTQNPDNNYRRDRVLGK